MRLLPLTLLFLGCGRSATSGTTSGIASGTALPDPAEATEWTPIWAPEAALFPKAVARDGDFLVVSAEVALCLFDVAAATVRACGTATGDVTEVAIHPSRDVFAIGTYGGAIEIWDFATWSRQQVLDGHEANVDDLLWADADTLLSASWDGTLRSWQGRPYTDTVLERERRSDGRPAWFRSLARHRSGRFAFTVDRQVRVRNPDESVAELLVDANVTSIEFSPSGDRLAIALYDGSVQIWDGRSANTRGRFSAYSDYMGDVHWLDDERLIVSGRGGPAKIVDASGQLVEELALTQDGGPVDLLLSPDRGRVFAMSAEGLHVLSGAPLAGRLLRPRRRHGFTAAFHGSRPTLAMAVVDGGVLLANLSEPRFARGEAADGGTLQPVAVAPDGRFAVGHPDGTVRVLDADGRLLRSLDRRGAFESYGFGRNTRVSLRVEIFHLDAPKHLAWAGARIAVASNERIQIFDAETGQREQVIAADPDSREIAALALSADGRHLAYGSDGGFVWVVDLDGRQIVARGEMHGSIISGLAFAPDGQRLATTGQDGFLKVVDLSGGATLLEVEHESRFVLGVAWSPDGARLASSCEAVVYVWSADDGAPIARVRGHARTPWRLGFMHGGRYLASFADDTIIVDVDDPDRRLVLRGWMTDGVLDAMVYDNRGRFDFVGDADRLRFRGPGDVRTAPLRTGTQLASQRRVEGLAQRFFADSVR